MDLSVASQYAIVSILLFLSPCWIPDFKNAQQLFWICSLDLHKCLFQSVVFMVVHGLTEVVASEFPEITTSKLLNSTAVIAKNDVISSWGDYELRYSPNV
jgi:hypothetical protein